MFDICSVCVSPVEFKEPQIDALQKDMYETHNFKKAVRFRNAIINYCPEWQAEIEPRTPDENDKTTA